MSTSIRATREERQRRLPGDEFLPHVLGSLTHAVTITAPPAEVWPWLVQMGAGRAGWYSYDLLDNGRRPSASRVVPELQQIDVGSVFPALPGRTDGFSVVAFERERVLVLGWWSPEHVMQVTWVFVLDPVPEGTRLIVRARGGETYRFHGLSPVVSKAVVRIVHLIMERRQLLQLKARVEQRDALLDRFMPQYDVVERHQVIVDAPAAIALDTARRQDLFAVPIVRAIFRARELAMGTRGTTWTRTPSRGLLDELTAHGWGILADVPGREIVAGAVTEPWEANVVFRSIPPEQFAAYAEPGHVKIAWTLRADPIGPNRTRFRTETRAVATDPVARARFRRYWRLVSPGIILIRRLMLAELKHDAERTAA